MSLSYGQIKKRARDNSGLLPESFDTYNIIEDGDIVLRLTDLQNDKVSLRVGRSSERGIITSAYTTLAPRAESKYLFYMLASFDYWKGFYGLAGGVRQSLNYDGIKNLRFLLPSRDEQTAIADYLDEKTAEIDSLIEQTERSIELLEEYRKSVISEAVTKGLNPDAPMKDSGIEWIGEIPEHWESVRVKTICTYRNGLTYSPDNISDQGTLVLRSSNIKNGKLDLTDNVFVDLDIAPQFQANKGDVLICSRNGSKALIGKNALVNEDGMSFGAFMMLAKPICNSKYFYYLLNSGVFDYYLPTYLTSTVNQLTNSNFGAMYVPFTRRVDEQNEIAEYLDDFTASVDRVIQDKRAYINILGEYRKSIISDAVTGKFKVPGVE